MRKLLYLLPMSLLLSYLISCTQADLEKFNAVIKNPTPTNAEMISGIKEALKYGSKEAATSFAAKDGYFGNSLYKILLPPEASTVTQHIAKIPGGQKMVDDVVLRINRAAEKAAANAAPIFADAITGMTVTDALNILKGDNNSATKYLDNTTRSKLVALYKPDMDKALAEPIVAGISAAKSWDTLAGNYNKVAASLVGKAAGMKSVDVNLNDYVLNKAVDALFQELAVKEAAIRANPAETASSIITKVFGYAKTLK